MPQFDFFTFSSQVFWSMILFYSFYYVLTQIFLVKISEVLKWREKRKKQLTSKEKAVSLFSLLVLYLI